MSLFFISLSLFLHLDTNPVEALDFLLLVLPLFAEGQQLILQIANLLLQLCGLRVEALFLPLKHTAKTLKIPHFHFCVLVLLNQHHLGPLEGKLQKKRDLKTLAYVTMVTYSVKPIRFSSIKCEVVHSQAYLF